MRVYILVLLVSICSLSTLGQNRKINNRDIQKIEEANETVIQALDDSIAVLKRNIRKQDSIINRLSKRQFPRVVSEDEITKVLETKNLKDICKDKGIRKKLKSATCKLAKDYSLIIEMYESLDKAYDESSNDEYIKKLKEITVLTEHTSEFKNLSSCINDYRFVTYELVRVLKIIDELSKEAEDTIMERLENDGDLDYITRDHPFVWRNFKDYIGVKNDKEAKETILNKLRKSCPGAFNDNQ